MAAAAAVAVALWPPCRDGGRAGCACTGAPARAPLPCRVISPSCHRVIVCDGWITRRVSLRVLLREQVVDGLVVPSLPSFGHFLVWTPPFPPAGALAAGHDLGTANVSWSDAVARCNNTAGCAGFTFESPTPQPAGKHLLIVLFSCAQPLCVCSVCVCGGGGWWRWRWRRLVGCSHAQPWLPPLQLRMERTPTASVVKLFSLLFSPPLAPRSGARVFQKRGVHQRRLVVADVGPGVGASNLALRAAGPAFLAVAEEHHTPVLSTAAECLASGVSEVRGRSRRMRSSYRPATLLLLLLLLLPGARGGHAGARICPRVRPDFQV